MLFLKVMGSVILHVAIIGGLPIFIQSSKKEPQRVKARIVSPQPKPPPAPVIEKKPEPKTEEEAPKPKPPEVKPKPEPKPKKKAKEKRSKEKTSTQNANRQRDHGSPRYSSGTTHHRSRGFRF